MKSGVIRLEKINITFHSGRNPYYSLRGEILPMFSLEADLGTASKSKSEIALIVKHGNGTFAVVISDIIKQQQVVVKPPTKEIYGKEGVMGTTILGDGKPALIIDLLDLYLKRLRKESSVNIINIGITA